MVLDKRPKAEIFADYVYHRICKNYSWDGIPQSHKYLCELANCGENIHPDEAQAKLYPRIAEKYLQKILLIDKAMTKYYQIDADVDDDKLLESTVADFNKVLQILPKSTPRFVEARLAVYDNLYELHEQLCPSGQETRFAILQQIVAEIKNNDGRFDHDPLNITARRVDYFMKKISPKKRYALLLNIKKRTQNSEKYNYDQLIEKVREEYVHSENVAYLEQREDNQWRYSVIKDRELSACTDNQEKIMLYNEMLGLVKDLDLNRQQKFKEKKQIYSALIPLYKAEGMLDEMQQARQEYEKFDKARKNCIEAAKRKGYQGNTR